MTYEPFELYTLIICICIFIFLIDDLFIDLFSQIYQLKPKPISEASLTELSHKRLLAIMVANWKEEDVLEAMVRGNLNQIHYQQLHIFLGVYENDVATKKIAERLTQEFNNVHVVVNSALGPTYKGQMLNEIVHHIINYENINNIEFEGFVLHDSEDVIHPYLPHLYAINLGQADFIQTPVLSFSTPVTKLTGGTYMDEFAEVHTKDLLLRNHLKVALPSAGVGTCLSRRLILTFLAKQNGLIFLPNSLTEDYQLGLQSHKWGFKSLFSCYYLNNDKKNIISVREYFPEKVTNSVRQKTRWTTGIAFQGTRNFKWFGSFTNKYFLWRDRRAPLNGFLLLNLILFLFIELFTKDSFFSDSYLISFFMGLNTTGALLRLCVRANIVRKIYGPLQGALSFIRWPLAMFINMLAAGRSAYEFYWAQINNQSIQWVKTSHKMPVSFGRIPDRPQEQHTAQEANL